MRNHAVPGTRQQRRREAGKGFAFLGAIDDAVELDDEYARADMRVFRGNRWRLRCGEAFGERRAALRDRRRLLGVAIGFGAQAFDLGENDLFVQGAILAIAKSRVTIGGELVPERFELHDHVVARDARLTLDSDNRAVRGRRPLRLKRVGRCNLRARGDGAEGSRQQDQPNQLPQCVRELPRR